MTFIAEKYAAMGGEQSFLGDPKAPERPCPDGVGRHRHFEGGSIHWSPNSGAHATGGLIRQKWEALKWEASPLGYPISDEQDWPKGRFSAFQGGVIAWRGGTREAFELHGAIHKKWKRLGGMTGLLGCPTTDEQINPDRRGRFGHFEHGSIYWTPEFGAYEVHGAIRARWAQLGSERSRLGYPTSDEKPGAPTGRVSRFEGGSIAYTKQVEAREAITFRPRRLLLTGTVSITDRDTFSSNETEVVAIDKEKVIDRLGVRFPLVIVDEDTDAEVSTTVHLHGQVIGGGAMRLDGSARKFASSGAVTIGDHTWDDFRFTLGRNGETTWNADLTKGSSLASVYVQIKIVNLDLDI